MTIDKAIEILEICSKGEPYQPGGDAIKAVQLGNEALKIVLKCRKETCSGASFPIPGETPEGG